MLEILVLLANFVWNAVALKIQSVSIFYFIFVFIFIFILSIVILKHYPINRNTVLIATSSCRVFSINTLFSSQRGCYICCCVFLTDAACFYPLNTSSLDRKRACTSSLVTFLSIVIRNGMYC